MDNITIIALLCGILGNQLDSKVSRGIWYFVGTICFLAQFV